MILQFSTALVNRHFKTLSRIHRKKIENKINSIYIRNRFKIVDLEFN
jgi:hypothetical protein